MKIFCTGCEKEVEARLTDGKEMYPHRSDLYELPFWKCDSCGAFVGTHHKTSERTKPLGYLATPALKKWRMAIHSTLDPLWKEGKIKRGQAYAYISHRLGKVYHSAEIRSAEEGRQVYEIVKTLRGELLQKES